MDGKHGPLDISTLVEVVERNKYKPNIRWISGQGGPTEAPSGVVTCLVGAWLLNAYGQLAAEHGTNYNVTSPFIPEYTVMKKSGHIEARGWRSILTEMIYDRVIRPSREIEKMLGYGGFEKATRGLGCF